MVAQPPATGLVDYARLELRLEELAARPGVHMSSLGRSVQGREIFLLVLSDTDDPEVLARYRVEGRRVARPEVHGNRIDQLEVGNPVAGGTRVPVLFAGAAFGDEAAHVEALVELVDRLAGSPLLERIVILIVPLMNPDGREKAIAEWIQTPESSGSAGEANANGQLLNRDFLYASQPETSAINRLLNEWDPLVVWDVHEDAVSLGRQFDEVCLAPPTAPEPPPGIPMALEAEGRNFGNAIASAWQEAGFRQLHHPDGLHGWTAPEDGAPTRMTGFIGRLAYAAGLRGAVAFITESARTIGVQSWEDRIRQKVLAGEAVAKRACEVADQLVSTVAGSRLRLMRQHRRSFYVLPVEQPPEALAAAVRVLELNGVALHQTEERDTVIAVGLQPNVSSLRALGGAFAPHDGLTQTTNVRFVSSESMGEAERARWLSATLIPFVGLTPVREVSYADSPSGVSEPARIKYSRRTAMYCDIGVTLREGSSRGSISWLLGRSGVDFDLVGAAEVAAGRLRDFDTLIVANGNAEMILGGYPDDDTWYGAPWAKPRDGVVLGQPGCDALKEFVKAGGTYIGIDAGGGWLATNDHLGIVDATRFGADLGLGAIDLHISQPSSSIFSGCQGSYGPAGEWRAHVLHVAYGGEGHRGTGSAYEVADDVAVLARYGAAHSIPGVSHLVNGETLAGAAAIIEQRYGDGRAVLFGFDPAFRCYWSSTYPLLLSALEVPNR